MPFAVLPRATPHASHYEALWASRGLASGAPGTSRVEAAQLSDHHAPTLFGRRIAFPIKALLDGVPRATVQAPPAILNVRVDAAFVCSAKVFASQRQGDASLGVPPLRSSSRDDSTVLLAALPYATQAVSAEVAAPQASSAMVDQASPPAGFAASQASSAKVDIAPPRPLPPRPLLAPR